MGKLKVNLVDRTFSMCGPSCGTGQTGIAPKNMEWVTNGDSDINVFTDMCINEPLRDSKYNIAWIIESRAISPHLYQNLEKYDRFDYVLTHDRNLLETSEKFVFTPLCGHWIYPDDCKIHPKTKNLSIIASGKKQAPGHLLRHEAIEKFGNRMDGIFGNGYQFVANKIEGLKDFRFHIVIENVSYDYWFTEKLIDAFVTGCIPIYYGTPGIGRYFNIQGMLCFDTVEQFEYIIDTYVDKSYYELCLLNGSIEDNFQRAQSFLTPEDYMYNKLLRKLV